MKGWRFRLATVSAAVGFAWLGCAEPGPNATKPKNLLWIVVDTLRADHLGCYGYARPTSPSIDALAATGVRFERAYATASWTKPSVASMITGLHPAALGIDNIFSRLPASADTTAEILSRAGYRTAAVVSHVMLSDRWNMGYGQGYEVYAEDEARGHDTVSTGGVTDRAIAQLAALSRGNEPFLLFVHYFDPHFAYLGHDEVDFAGQTSERLDGRENIVALREKLDTLDAKDFAFLRDRYDEEIRHTDAGIGRLLDALRESGHEANTVVALTSDHGEELGEKGWVGHTRTLYEFVLRVPLIVRVPSDPGGRVIATPVSLVSLTPSLLDLVGVPVASDSFHGRSFAAAVRDVRPLDRAQEVFAEIDFPLQDPRISPVRLQKRAVIGERYKLIVDDEAETVALYDLAADPEERRDISAGRPEVREQMLATLRERVEAAREGGPPAETVPLTREELEVLEKLGYVETAPEGAVSPDPRP